MQWAAGLREDTGGMSRDWKDYVQLGSRSAFLCQIFVKHLARYLYICICSMHEGRFSGIVNFIIQWKFKFVEERVGTNSVHISI